MKVLFFSLIFVVLLLFQLTFANLMAIYEIKPDFILIFVIYLSLHYGRLWGSGAGFLMGVIEDNFLVMLFGLNALCKSLVGFFVARLSWRWTGRAITDGGLLLFVAALVHDFLFNWIYAFGSEVGVVYILFRYALPGAVYTAIIGMMITAIFPGFLQVSHEED